MAVNAEELFVEVAMERSSLRVKLVVASSLGRRRGVVICTTLCVVDVLVLTSGAFLISFAVPRGAIDADVEDRATPERWERGLLGEGFSEGLHRALELRVWIFLQNGLEGCSVVSASVQHVDHWQELVNDLFGERMDILHLVGEFAP